ncbi:hypothetical protein A2U01_0109248, partial [Trifolium medium]|nr:hypothetical protein [Trifolium medium]
MTDPMVRVLNPPPDITVVWGNLSQALSRADSSSVNTKSSARVTDIATCMAVASSSFSSSRLGG